MSVAPWHKRFHDDALNGYMGLTLEERGAYTTLLDLLYQRGEALLDNERMLSGWMQCSVRKYRVLRERLIELGKVIRLDDGRLSNPRFEKEAEKARETSRANAESGKIGGEKSGEVRKKAREINGEPKRSLQKNEAISEAQISEDSSDNSEKIINVVVPADAGPTPSKYAFEATNIKLTRKHLDGWKQAYSHIPVEAELWAMDEWAGEIAGKGKNWFPAVSSALAKKEREATDRINLRRAEMSTPRRQHFDGRI